MSAMRDQPAPTTPRFARRLLLAAAPAAMALPRAAASAPPPAGHAEDIKGRVTAELAARRRMLAPRSDVFVGDDVATGEAARAVLQLGRDTSLRLGGNARLRIDRFIVNAGGTLTLEDGPLLLDKEKGSPSSPLEVRGSFGLIAVRGTRIFVGPSQGAIGIFVVHGLIDVTAGGSSFVLQTGEGTSIAHPGGPASPPAAWGKARIQAALASVE